MDQIVLQISALHQNFFVNAGRIMSYLNRFFIKYMDSMQYCEDLANGFLFIFRDFDAFKIRTEPLPPSVLKDINTKFLPGVNFFKYFFVPPKKFPSEGADIQVKVVTGNPEQTLPLVKAFVLSIDRRISIQDLLPDTFLFHVPSYSIIQKYLNSLIRRFYIGKK